MLMGGRYLLEARQAIEEGHNERGLIAFYQAWYNGEGRAEGRQDDLDAIIAGERSLLSVLPEAHVPNREEDDSLTDNSLTLMERYLVVLIKDFICDFKNIARQEFWEIIEILEGFFENRRDTMLAADKTVLGYIFNLRGFICERQSIGSDTLEKRAVGCYERAGWLGDPAGKFNLGRMLLKCKGGWFGVFGHHRTAADVLKFTHRGLAYCEEAADLGFVPAMMGLADRYKDTTMEMPGVFNAEWPETRLFQSVLWQMAAIQRGSKDRDQDQELTSLMGHPALANSPLIPFLCAFCVMRNQAQVF